MTVVESRLVLRTRLSFGHIVPLTEGKIVWSLFLLLNLLFWGEMLANLPYSSSNTASMLSSSAVLHSQQSLCFKLFLFLRLLKLSTVSVCNIGFQMEKSRKKTKAEEYNNSSFKNETWMRTAGEAGKQTGVAEKEVEAPPFPSVPTESPSSHQTQLWAVLNKRNSKKRSERYVWEVVHWARCSQPALAEICRPAFVSVLSGFIPSHKHAHTCTDPLSVCLFGHCQTVYNISPLQESASNQQMLCTDGRRWTRQCKVTLADKYGTDHCRLIRQ